MAQVAAAGMMLWPVTADTAMVVKLFRVLLAETAFIASFVFGALLIFYR